MNNLLAKPLSFPPTPPPPLPLGEALAAAAETKALLVGIGVNDKIDEVFRANFPEKFAIVVCDPTTLSVAGAAIHQKLQVAGLTKLAPLLLRAPDLYAEYRFVEELIAALAPIDAVPIAVGSGTINDLVKLAAHKLNRSYLCVGTAASMDGYTAFGASITFQGAKQTFNCPAPRAVVADIEVLRRAPEAMTASGYADLQAKITAGADWLLAHALEVEPIDSKAWSIVQGGLRDALADPAGAKNGDPRAISALTEGLMLGGFAMQWSKSSRPASGAEHQFSHLWDMEHHTHNGHAPSHGFKVGIATLAVTSLYEALLKLPLEKIDIDRCVQAWPEWPTLEAEIRAQFAQSEFLETALTETSAKYVNATTLREQLRLVAKEWPALKEQLRIQLLPLGELRRRLEIIGAPTRPADIGITPERLRQTFRRAYYIRRRFTVLDFAVRTGTLEPCLDTLFGTSGIWSR